METTKIRELDAIDWFFSRIGPELRILPVGSTPTPQPNPEEQDDPDPEPVFTPRRPTMPRRPLEAPSPAPAATGKPRRGAHGAMKFGALGLALALSACVAGEGTDTTTVDAPLVPFEASDEPTGEAQEPLPIVSFGPSEFPFRTLVPDDGKDDAGGWQVANANLAFSRLVFPHPRRHWQCSLTIGMPLRTELAGRISASRAARVSARVAADVARSMDADYDLPPGVFCKNFASEVLVLFKSRHPTFGVTVTR